MSWLEYAELKIPFEKNVNVKKKYSITRDILSFQLCLRQYGFFTIRGYQPANVVQYWYGTIIHQVLDKLHLHYQGLLDENTKNTIPTDLEVENYFNNVESSLKARGIRSINKKLKMTALNVLKIFNRIEGPKLYPKVIDTECDLQSDQGSYILHGVVDLLKEVSTTKKTVGFDKVEIWDYKGSEFPDLDSPFGKNKLARYKFQMLVYAELYKLKNGFYPLKGILYFMEELDDDNIEETPIDATYIIEFRDQDIRKKIEEALGNFSDTVDQIEKHLKKDQWNPPKVRPDAETCDICDLRWNCTTVKDLYPMRYP